MSEDDLTVDELRDAWVVLSLAERYEGFQRLERKDADDFFLELSPSEQSNLLLSLQNGERRLWFRLLPPDDAADVIQDLDEEDREGFLNLLDNSTRREVVALLAYAEDAAGGLMSPRFARLRPEMTVDEAIRYLRRQAREYLETIYYAYVLDQEQRLLGVVSFRDLFAAPGEKKLSEVMQTDVISVSEDLDQEAVAKLIAQHDLDAVPVLDPEGHMKGIVTVDDIVDVVQREATEDIQKLGGMEALDTPYMETGFVAMLRKRAGWLSILFVGELLTASAMGRYEHQIAQAVVLAMFVPLIISSGGNSGSQATSLIIRALALGEVTARDWWLIVRRELLTGVALGGILAALGVLRIILWQTAFHTYTGHVTALSTIVGVSLIGVVVWGTVAGSMLPLVIRRLGFDPASASAPFVATLVDVSGLIIYFNVAQLVMRAHHL